jgi:hypothetical protein
MYKAPTDDILFFLTAAYGSSHRAPAAAVVPTVSAAAVVPTAPAAAVVPTVSAAAVVPTVSAAAPTFLYTNK